jgi:hypothetical protein
MKITVDEKQLLKDAMDMLNKLAEREDASVGVCIHAEEAVYFIEIVLDEVKK